MKNGMLLFMALVLVGCESKKSKTASEDLLASNTPTNSCCDILTETYIKTVYPNATDFTQKPSESPYPSCYYSYSVDGDDSFSAVLTIVDKYGSEKNLDRALSRFKEKELLEGIGDKAYYIPSMHQVSLYKGKKIMHVGIGKNKEATILAAKAFVKEL